METIYHKCNKCSVILSGYNKETGTYFTNDKYWMIRKELGEIEPGYEKYTDFYAICKKCYAPTLCELEKKVKGNKFY